MWDGKKSTAESVFYQAMDHIEQKLSRDPLEVFKQAVENIKPLIEVRSKRVGGATYQVPIEVTSKRQLSLAIRWILEAARSKKGRPMHLKLASELIDAFNKEGAAHTTRENIHKMAEANKAFAHFAW
jgi:small subunit ribosomal protein S7